MKKLFLFVLISLSLSSLAFAQEKSHAKVELISGTAALVPGTPVTLGLHFTMDKGWHIYWQNPGDAGLAPSVSWILPAGFKTSGIVWPIPQRISLPSVMDFGYEGETTLWIPVTVPKGLTPGDSFKFTANVQWLVCSEQCIPGQAILHLTLPIADSNVTPVTINPVFTQSKPKLPLKFPTAWKKSGTLDSKQVVLNFQTGTVVDSAIFFPGKNNQIDNTSDQTFSANNGGFSLTFKRSDQMLQDVQTLEGLIVLESGKVKKGYWVNIPLSKN